MLSPWPYIAILVVFILGAITFHHPQWFRRIVRLVVQHKRDRAAAEALRKMRYTDIRRPK